MELLTVGEAARFLRVSRVTIYRLCDRAAVPWYVLPNVSGRRFKRADLEQLLVPGRAAALGVSPDQLQAAP